MRTSFKISLVFILFSLVFVSCKKDPETVTGCTDSFGDNYNAEASIDNGSCTFQKRFLGVYAGEFKCKGSFAAVFSMADLSVTELIKKDEVNIIIQTSIGPLPVLGKLSKNQITIDATITDLKIKPSDIIPGASTTEIKADGTVQTVLTISDDNKKLTGVLNVSLITKEPLPPLPAGIKISDECDFVGTKK